MVDTQRKTPSIVIEQIRAAILDGLYSQASGYWNEFFANALQYGVGFYLPGKVRPSERLRMRIKVSIPGENKPHHRPGHVAAGQERLIL